MSSRNYFEGDTALFTRPSLLLLTHEVDSLRTGTVRTTLSVPRTPIHISDNQGKLSCVRYPGCFSRDVRDLLRNCAGEIHGKQLQIL